MIIGENLWRNRKLTVSKKRSETVAENKKAIVRLKKTRTKKIIDVELIPVYVSEQEFMERKVIIQNLLAKILISSEKEKGPVYAA